ncbi:hypothetical protein RB195_002559 [Necator americanus]|uniref:Selenium binding protein n=1 Tax=Necator americanus TaxID=51031 RepID=A0ABR1DL11_NECAM
MGVCMSQEEEIRHLTLNAQPNYIKTDKKDPKIAPEHTIYNYDSSKQDREKLAVLNCPHSVGFHPDRLVIVDLDENSASYCKVGLEVQFTSVMHDHAHVPLTVQKDGIENELVLTTDNVPHLRELAPSVSEVGRQRVAHFGYIDKLHLSFYLVVERSHVGIPFTSDCRKSVVSVLTFPDVNDEPGRINWTRSARSLETMSQTARTHMVVPCMNSNRVYIVEVDENEMKLVKTIGPELLKHYDISCPYAVHVLPLKGAPVHIATMGDTYGNGKGDFLLIDRNSFEIRERHNRTGFTGFGGDFSFQTRRNLLIASEWGHPRLFRDGFTRSEIENVSESFGSQLHVWQISPGILKESIDLGPFDGCLITTVRFLHNPECNHAFACSAVGSSVFHLYMNSLTEKWSADKVFQVKTIQVENWLSPEMPALLTDLVISMEDRFAYVAGWLHGCIWQLDISDPFRISVLTKVKAT